MKRGTLGGVESPSDRSLAGAAAPAELARDLEAAFEEHGRFLHGVCYRMTGCTADAEDLVQATFARALERPPADTARPWRPWLTKVAVNLGRDHLRRRRRRHYDGPWLPSPLETQDAAALLESPWAGEPDYEPAHDPAGTENRYELLESVSYAFVLALERLTPTQRAVLLLRDVFEYSGAETALALGLAEPNVRQHLRRARAAMQDYERTRPSLAPDPQATQQALEAFLTAIGRGDMESVERLLADDVVLTTDAGGEFHAARVEVHGASKVARFHVNIVKVSGVPRVELRTVNGMPAVIGEVPSPRPGIAPRFVTVGWLDAEGRIARIYSVLATRKLRGVGPITAPQGVGR